jgi:hypothetical protein
MGGLKGPCIFSLDATLKLKQVMRAAQAKHDIAKAQGCSTFGTTIKVYTNTANRFTAKWVKTYS